MSAPFASCRRPLIAGLLSAVATGAIHLSSPTVAAAEPATLDERADVIVLEMPTAGSSAALDVARRISAELDAAGLRTIPRAEGGTPRAPGSVWAAIQLVDGPRGLSAIVRVGVGDRAAVERDVDVSDVERVGAASALAVRVLEALRAALVELAAEPAARAKLSPTLASFADLEPAPSDPAVATKPGPAPAPQPELAPPSRRDPDPAPFVALDDPSPTADTSTSQQPSGMRRTWIGADFAGLASYGALGRSLGPRLHVSHELPYHFAIGASTLVTFPVHEVDGSALQVLAIAEGSYSLGAANWPVRPRFGVGLGFHVFYVQDDAPPDGLTPDILATNVHDAGLSFVLAATTGFEARMTSHMRFIAGFGLLAVVPEPVVDFGELSDGAHNPMFTTSFGLELCP
ncbi:MAG: hypothetical protein U0271_36520 [Polyangiaceae bacterium]